MNHEAQTKVELSKMSSYFLTLTTLHGFKYLHSPYKSDKLMWAVCCLASAVCAAILCTVLWTRFVRNSVLLTLDSDLPRPSEGIAVCQRNVDTAMTMFRSMNINESYSKTLALALGRTLERHKMHEKNLRITDALLLQHNLTIESALLKYAPPCDQLVKRCRLNGRMRPCDKLFHLKLTDYGACCVMNGSLKQKSAAGLRNYFMFNYTLSIVINCSTESKMCKLLMETENGEDKVIMKLAPALDYFAIIKLTVIQDRTTENMVKRNCEERINYNRGLCLLGCAEKICGCSNSITSVGDGSIEELRPCYLTEYSCLWKIMSVDSRTCACPRNCNAADIEVKLYEIPMKSVSTSIDPFYYGIDVSNSIVFHTWTSKALSRAFVGISTDSWLTLLSSLGGVFNVFLGVGLFTVVEFIYFLINRIPLAMRRAGDASNK